MAILLTAALLLTAPGMTGWADSSKNSSNRKSTKSTTHTISDFATTLEQIVSVAKDGTHSMGYVPLLAESPGSTEIQSIAQLAVAQGTQINNFGFLTWTSQLSNEAQKTANILSAGAVSHGVDVGVSIDDILPVYVTPQITTTQQEVVALRDPTVQELLTQNKMTWNDLEGALESDRADLQARVLKIQMEADRQGIESMANQAQTASANATKAADEALKAAEEAQGMSEIDPNAAMNAARPGAEQAIQAAEEAQQQVDAAKKAITDSAEKAKKALDALKAQIADAPPALQKDLSKLVAQLQSQIADSLAKASEQVEIAAQAAAKAKEAAQRAAAAANIQLPANLAPDKEPGLWDKIGNGFKNLGYAFSHPGEYASQLSQLAWGGAKTLLGTSLAILAATNEGIPILGQLMTPLNAAAFLAGESLAASGLMDAGNAVSSMWNRNNQWDALNRANTANTEAALANKLATQAKAMESKLSKENFDPKVLQKAGERLDATFSNAVREAIKTGSLDKIYSSANAAIAQLTQSINDLKAGSDKIGKTFRNFDGLMRSLYKSTAEGDKAYHDVLGDFVQFDALEKQTDALQKSYSQNPDFQQYTRLEKGAFIVGNQAKFDQLLSGLNPAGVFTQQMAGAMYKDGSFNPSWSGMDSLLGQNVMQSLTSQFTALGGMLGYGAGKISQLFGGDAFGLRSSSLGEIVNNPVLQNQYEFFGQQVNGAAEIVNELGITDVNKVSDPALKNWLNNQQIFNNEDLVRFSQMNFGKVGKNYYLQSTHDSGWAAVGDAVLGAVYQTASVVPTIVGVGSTMGLLGPTFGNGLTGGLQYYGVSQGASSAIGSFTTSMMGQVVALPFMAEYGKQALDLGGKFLAHLSDGYTFTNQDIADVYDTVGQAVSFAFAQKVVGGFGITGTEELFKTTGLKDFVFDFGSDVAFNSAKMLGQFGFSGLLGGGWAGAIGAATTESAWNSGLNYYAQRYAQDVQLDIAKQAAAGIDPSRVMVEDPTFLQRFGGDHAQLKAAEDAVAYAEAGRALVKADAAVDKAQEAFELAADADKAVAQNRLDLAKAEAQIAAANSTLLDPTATAERKAQAQLGLAEAQKRAEVAKAETSVLENQRRVLNEETAQASAKEILEQIQGIRAKAGKEERALTSQETAKLAILEREAGIIEKMGTGESAPLSDATRNLEIESAEKRATENRAQALDAFKDSKAQDEQKLRQVETLAQSAVDVSEKRLEAEKTRVVEAERAKTVAESGIIGKVYEALKSKWEELLGRAAGRLEIDAENALLSAIESRSSERAAVLDQDYEAAKDAISKLVKLKKDDPVEQGLADKVRKIVGEKLFTLPKPGQKFDWKGLEKNMTSVYQATRAGYNGEAARARLAFASRRGHLAEVARITSAYLAAGSGKSEEFAQRSRDLQKLVQEGLPGHKALLFDQLVEGKRLYDGPGPDSVEFKNWLDKHIIQNLDDPSGKSEKTVQNAFTREGFEDLWKKNFLDASEIQARLLLTGLLGKDPIALIRGLEEKIKTSLRDGGVIDESFAKNLFRNDEANKNKSEFAKLLSKNEAERSGAEKKIAEVREALFKDIGIENEKVILGRLFADAVLSGTHGYRLRAAQGAGVGSFARGENIIVEAGGGKTEVFAVDQFLHHLIGGELFRGELLVENATAAKKYAGKSSVNALARAFGVKLVDGTDLQAKHETARLIEAFRDPHTVVILDPVTRGHLINEAFGNRDLRLALQESNIVGFDEVHFFATGRTAAIRGADAVHPGDLQVKRITDLFYKLDGVMRIGPEGERILNGDVVKFVHNEGEFRTELERLNNEGKEGVVVYRRGGKTDVAVSDKLEGRFRIDFETGEVGSVVRTLVTDRNTPNSYDFGIDKKTGNTIVFPVDEFGYHQTEQINQNTNEQIAQVLKYRSDKAFLTQAKEKGLNLDPKTTVRRQRTHISTSLSAIFENGDARLVGGSATLEGLDLLLQGRLGAKAVNISGSSLDLQKLVIDRDTGRHLRAGSILQDVEGFENLDLNKLPSNLKDLPEHPELANLIAQMKARLGNGNLIIATEDPKLAEFYKRVFEKENIGEVALEDENGNQLPGKKINLSIEGATSSEEVSGIAKIHGEGKVLIINPRAYTGVDFQLKGDLYVLGAEKLGEQDLVQLLKRVNRPDPKRDGVRWDASRHLVLTNVGALEGSLAFAEDHAAQLQAIFGARENGRPAQEGRVSPTYLLSKYLDNVKDPANKPELILKEKIELNAFIRQASINSEAAKFAIRDTLRDRYVIQPLKDALSRFVEGSPEHDIFSRALDKALNNDSNYEPLTVADYAKTQTSDDYLRNTFAHVASEARSVLEGVQSELKGSGKFGVLREWIKVQRGEVASFELASKNFENIGSNSELSLGKAKSAEDLISVVNSIGNLVLDGKTAVQVTDQRAAVAAEATMNQVQKAVREAQRDTNSERPGRVSVTAARNVFASLRGLNLVALPNGFQKQLFSQLVVAGSVPQVQRVLNDLVARINLNANGTHVPQSLAPVEQPTGFEGVRQAVTQTVSSAIDSIKAIAMTNLLPTSDAVKTQLADNLVTALQEPVSASSQVQQRALARLTEMADNPRTASIVFSVASRALAESDKNAPDKQIFQHLTQLRSAALVAAQSTVDFTIAREGIDAKALLTITIKKATKEAAARVAALTQLPVEQRLQITVNVTAGAAKNNEFVAGIKKQVRKATSDGADLYWGLADGRAVRLGVQGGRNNAEAVRGTLSAKAKIQLQLQKPVVKLKAAASTLQTKLQKPVVKTQPTIAPEALTPVSGANLVSHETSMMFMAGLSIVGIGSAILAAVGSIPLSLAVGIGITVAGIGAMWAYVTRPIGMPTAPPALIETTQPPVKIVAHPEADEHPYRVDAEIRNQHNEPDRFLPEHLIKKPAKTPATVLARVAKLARVHPLTMISLIMAIPISLTFGAGSAFGAGKAAAASVAAFFGAPSIGWVVAGLVLVGAGVGLLVHHLKSTKSEPNPAFGTTA